jgi:hypothetical protein
MTAARALVRGFAEAVTVTLSPLAPLAGATDNQLADAGTLAVQPDIFVVTVTAWLKSSVAPKLTVWLDTVTVGVTGVAAAWVTVNVATADPAVHFTVPVRVAVVVLAAAVIVTTVPFAPVGGLTVSQPSAERAIQATTFDATVVVAEPPAAGI